jgi:hypothetical protein
VSQKTSGTEMNIQSTVTGSMTCVYVFPTPAAVDLRLRMTRGFVTALLTAPIALETGLVGLVGEEGRELEVDRLLAGVVLVERVAGVAGSGNWRGWCRVETIAIGYQMLDGAVAESSFTEVCLQICDTAERWSVRKKW